MRDKLIIIITILAFIIGCLIIYNITRPKEEKIVITNNNEEKIAETCYIETSFGNVGEDYKKNISEEGKCYKKDNIIFNIDDLAVKVNNMELSLTIDSKIVNLNNNYKITNIDNIYKDAMDNIVMLYSLNDKENGKLLLIIKDDKLAYSLKNTFIEIKNDGNQILYKDYTELGLKGIKKCDEYKDNTKLMWTKGQIIYNDGFEKKEIIKENVEDVCE